MTNHEKRQTALIVRNARRIERELFELVDELIESQDGDEPHDWASTEHHLNAVKVELPILVDFVKDIRHELGR